MTLSEELSWRGFAHQTTYENPTVLDKGNLTFYWGVDPSSDSMTIGNLAAAMMVKAFMKHGHKAVLLVGGATGLIGDPDGKSEERALKTPEEIEKNTKGIISQYQRIFKGHEFKIVNNNEWFKDIKFIDFLRDTGKHVPMRQMLNREFIQTRLGKDNSGISYAEFSYVLIQAYDFLRLYEDKKVTLQLCGSDQWGNSIAGVDLIRRKTGGEAHVYSAPLIVNTTTGKKFGKTEEGALWLDHAKTSPYQFYQFLLNVHDDSVIHLLKMLTELDKPEVDHLADSLAKDPGARAAQKALAFEVTKLVHGEAAAGTQQRIAQVLFDGDDPLNLTEEEYAVLDLPIAEVPIKMTEDDLLEALVKTGLANSKGDARRHIEGGAIYINNVKVERSSKALVDPGSSQAVVRRGKNANAILKLV